MDEEQINEALKNFELIATLHKKDLVSIEVFPKWSICSLYLNKIKSKCSTQDISQDLQTFENAFEELEDVLPELIASENLAKAYELHQSIKENLLLGLTPKRMSC